MLAPRPYPTFIKEWREFRGMTQATLGEKTGMTSQNVHYIETGKSNYTQKTLEAFAAALNCTVVDLLARNPADDDDFIGLWNQATPRQRRAIMAHSKAILSMDDE